MGPIPDWISQSIAELDAMMAAHKLKPKRWQSPPHKRVTYRAVDKAKRDGRLDKRPSCSQCGAPKALYHHDDYGKPLGVIPLCPPCHALVHPRPKWEEGP